jgi:hypothetical protein
MSSLFLRLFAREGISEEDLVNPGILTASGRNPSKVEDWKSNCAED